MESRLSTRTLLCRLVLVACVAWTHSFPLSKNLKDELKKLKSTIELTNVTDAERKEGGSIFKEQLQKMEKLFQRDDQKQLVLEMMSTYSRLFHNISKTANSQENRKEAQYLQDKIQELLKIGNGNKLVEMQHTIRNYKWNSVELMKALNDFDVVYDTASNLITKN